MPQPLSFSAPGRRLLFLFSRIFLFSRGNIHIDVENYPPSSGSVLFPFFPHLFFRICIFSLLYHNNRVYAGVNTCTFSFRYRRTNLDAIAEMQRVFFFSDFLRIRFFCGHCVCIIAGTIRGSFCERSKFYYVSFLKED